VEKILLYYPYTNIPDGRWLRNSLLYTDKVASILPYDMGHKRIPEETKLLFDKELYKPIYVFNELDPDNPEFKKFEDNFIDTITSVEFQSVKSNVQIFNADENKGLSDYVMYVNKLTSRIAQYLRENHLLKDTHNTNEVAVDKKTALIYMSMLADYLARKSKDLVTPSTDQREFEHLTFQLSNKKALTYRIELSDCLPTLLPDAKIEDIAAFKQKRRKELLRFREVLGEFEKAISSLTDEQERKEKIMEFQIKIEKELLEIKKLLGDSKLKFILNGLSSLLDFKQAGIVATLTSAGIIANLPFLGLGAGALSLTGTLVSSFKEIYKNVASVSASYIYYAQQGLLPK